MCCLFCLCCVVVFRLICCGLCCVDLFVVVGLLGLFVLFVLIVLFVLAALCVVCAFVCCAV